MLIAISGSHRVGKTTLAEALANALPGYRVVPEPHHSLQEDGYTFGDMPSVEDFELQLERSLECLEEENENVIFDRCPLDILGYLLTHDDRDLFQLEYWMPRVQQLLPRLNLVVFVPIEAPDRVAVDDSGARLRGEVDAILRDIVVDDAYGLGVHVMTVAGTTTARAHQVLAHLDRMDR